MSLLDSQVSVASSCLTYLAVPEPVISASFDQTSSWLRPYTAIVANLDTQPDGVYGFLYETSLLVTSADAHTRKQQLRAVRKFDLGPRIALDVLAWNVIQAQRCRKCSLYFRQIWTIGLSHDRPILHVPRYESP